MAMPIKCKGCLYEFADGSNDDISNCVICNRVNDIDDIARNDYYIPRIKRKDKRAKSVAKKMKLMR